MSLLTALVACLGLPLLLGWKDAVKRSGRWTAVALTALVLLAVLRSAVATRFDGLTYDEPYHITAGVSYVRTGDFRLNPEHPPLAKLFVGAALGEDAFKLPPFRPLADKGDERRFTQGAVYTDNDPAVVQTRARAGMFVLNALLLLAFALAVWRLLGSVPALAALGFLALDPTIAAHLPVVLTDLPVALASVTAVLATVLAHTEGRRRDLAAAVLALGAALGAKHSGLVVAVAVALLGAAWTAAVLGRGLRRGEGGRDVLRRAAAPAVRTVVIGVGALVVLWGLYGFRHTTEGFNLPLAEKIRHVRSPVLRGSLEVLDEYRLLPQSYVWGLADVTRSGLEGRIIPVYFLGRTLLREAPFYLFPTHLAVKLPLGLILLVVLGAATLVSRRALLPPRGWVFASAVGFAVLYLVTLGSSSSTYAGIRHALPVVPVLAMIAALAVERAWTMKSSAWRAATAVAVLVAAASALPVTRPWEYYNEVIGRDDAWLHFNDEGLDMGLRTLDAIRVYRELKSGGTDGEIFVLYGLLPEHRERVGLPDAFEQLDAAADVSSTVTGTFLMAANSLAPRPWYDFASFREAEPVDRVGNLLVYRGSFRLPWVRAGRLTIEGRRAEIDGKPAEAARLYSEALDLYPESVAVAIQLGNLQVRLGSREEAIRAFRTALEHAPEGEPIVDQLQRHLERLATEPLADVPELRNPMLE